jgi:hypothetical protein
VKRPKLTAYLKRKGKTEDEILAATNANDPIPDYIKLEDPHTEDHSRLAHVQRQQSDISPLTVTTLSGATMLSGSLSNQSTRLPTPVSSHEAPLEQISLLDLSNQRWPPASEMQTLSDWPSLSEVVELPSRTPLQPDMPAGSEPFNVSAELDTLESYNNIINQMLRPSTPAGTTSSQLNMLKIMYGTRQVSSQNLIRDLNHQHDILTNATAETNDPHYAADLPQRFLKSFFGSCMLYNQGSQKGASDSLRHARDLLEEMIVHLHPECLITLNVMLSVLEAHGQNHLVADFLSTMLRFSQTNLINNPVAATAEFMVNVATRKLKLDGAEVAQLRSIYELLSDRFGPNSSSALVGWYNVAWRMAKSEEHRDAALQTLKWLAQIASESLGSSHVLTITCITTMARVMFRTNRQEESIILMAQALETIGLRYAHFHPYRLEALHRLARFQIDGGQVADGANILIEVIVKRANILGQNNPLTRRSLDLLHRALGLTWRDDVFSGLEMELLSNSSVNEVHERFPMMAYSPVASPTHIAASRA